MRRVSRSIAAVLATLLLTASAAGAQTVDDIIAKNIAAKGGAEILKATTSVKTTGTGTMQGAELNITSITKRPYFVRNEMKMAGQLMIQGFDGQTLWMAMEGMPPQALPPGPQTEALKQSSQIDSPLLDYRAKGTKIELGNPLTDEGRTLHHLIVTPKGSPAMHYYIDSATNLESRMVIDIDDNGQKMKMEMRFSDFKTIEGRTMPFVVKQFVNGKEVGQMKYETVAFNVPVDDALFKMPK